MSQIRDAVLREMGLAPIWRLRSANVEDAGAEVIADPQPAAHREEGPTPTTPIVAAPPAPEVSARSGQHRVRELLPPVGRPAAPHREAPAHAGADPARTARITTLDWDALETDMRACQECRLCERRKQAVPGVGDRQADWLFVGEGPGAEEDQRGEPFVGAAGRLLDAMLGAIGLERGKGVYIANAVKCRPPHNRTPQADEIAACHPYLERQIDLIKPRLIVALGRPAALALLGNELSIGASRGRLFETAGIPVVVTYHPAYLLRNPTDKAKAWEDLCFARRSMAAAGA